MPALQIQPSCGWVSWSLLSGSSQGICALHWESLTISMSLLLLRLQRLIISENSEFSGLAIRKNIFSLLLNRARLIWKAEKGNTSLLFHKVTLEFRESNPILIWSRAFGRWQAALHGTVKGDPLSSMALTFKKINECMLL